MFFSFLSNAAKVNCVNFYILSTINPPSDSNLLANMPDESFFIQFAGLG